LVPIILLSISIALLLWEVTRANLPKAVLAQLPFAPVTIGIAPAAAFSGVLAGLLLARSQYVATNQPYITGHGSGWRPSGRKGRWSLTVHNVGAGLATVTAVEFLVGIRGTSDEPKWSDFDQARSSLSALGYQSGRDFDIHELSPGLPLKPATDRTNGVLVFSLARSVASDLSRFEIRIRFVNPLGDEYEWQKDLTRPILESL